MSLSCFATYHVGRSPATRVVYKSIQVDLGLASRVKSVFVGAVDATFGMNELAQSVSL